MKLGRFFACVSILATVGLAVAACQTEGREQSTVAAVEGVEASLETPAPAEPFGLGPVELGTAPPNPYSAAQIERGRYLVEFGGCHDCHTPWVYDRELAMPVPDMSRMLSGHPRGGPEPVGTIGEGDIGLIGPTFTSFRMPFGTVYSPNLTPDIDTGTGSWTEEMFIRIFRTGRHLGGAGRPVLPPMPFLNMSRLTDEDLVSIFAYLRSLEPVRNLVPSPDVPEPVMWSIRDAWDKILGIEPAAGDVQEAAS